MTNFCFHFDRMKDKNEFCWLQAVLILVLFLPVFTTATSITETGSHKLEKCNAAAKILGDPVEKKLITYNGFSEYDFCNINCTSEECKVTAKILQDSMDMQANPCDDFYQYACGNWPKNNRNATNMSDPSISLSPIKLRDIQNDEEIIEFLEQNDTQDEPDAVHKARKLYSNCINPDSFDGNQLLKNALSNISLPPSPDDFDPKESLNSVDYMSKMAKTNKIAGNGIFITMIGVNPYNHSANAIWVHKPSNSFVLQPIIQSQSTKQIPQTVKEVNITNKFEIFCNPQTVKIDVLKEITELEMIIAKASTAFNSSFELSIHTLEELQNITDNIVEKGIEIKIGKFNWTRYFEEIFNGSEVTLDLGKPSNVQIVITDMAYILDMVKYFHRQSDTSSIERTLWCYVVGTFLPYTYLNDFRKIYEITSNASQKQVCSAIVTRSLRMAVSYMYSKKEKYNIAKIEVDNMLEHVKKSYKKILEEASWMDQNTREKAVKKLASMKWFIAYPNSTELMHILSGTYSNFNVTRSFLASMMSLIQSRVESNLKKLNQINDPSKQKWAIPSTTVNAYYVPFDNSITIPAALLGPPLNSNSLKSLIYGSIGSIVGHEISHGFDHSNGRKYNSEGIPENWWDNKTSIAYEEKAKCFVKAYDSYDSTFQGIYQKGNSTLTLDEDISDNAGFKASLFAYRSYVSENGDELSLPNFENLTSDQLFTLGFANFWCENPSNSTSSMASKLAHSPNGVRVNGVLKNSKEFSIIWNCPKGTKMNLSDEKCTLF